MIVTGRAERLPKISRAPRRSCLWHTTVTISSQLTATEQELDVSLPAPGRALQPRGQDDRPARRGLGPDRPGRQAPEGALESFGGADQAGN
jgi:hypothetical protein